MKMRSAPEVADLIDGFPYPELTKIWGKPSRDKIIILEKELKANSSSVETQLGVGNNGHLGLMMTKEAYATRSATPFAIPPHPGLVPLFPVGTNQINARILTTQHKNLIYLYKLCCNVQNALKQQILTAIEHKYINNLEDVHTGYSNVLSLQILQHLYTNYGHVSDFDLEDNDAVFHKPINTDEPIKTIWKRIKDCCDFTEQGNTPYSASQILHNVKSVLKKTGLFDIDICEFDCLPIAEQTYKEIQQRLNIAWNEHQDDV